MPEIRVKKIPGLTAPYWDLSEYFLSLDGDQTLTPEQVAAIIASLGLGTMATQDEGTGSGDFRDNAANDARFVQLTGDQDVAGVKTFTSGLSIAMAEPQWAMTDTSDGNKAVAISLIGNAFVIAADRNGDGTVEAPLPLLLNSDTNVATIYGGVTISGNDGSIAGNSVNVNNVGSSIPAKIQSACGSSLVGYLCSANSTSTRTHMAFENNNGQVGSITTNGSSTSFNTSSDERLKDNFSDFDAGPIIDGISIYQYQWKADGAVGYGPKAQELHQVFPAAVSPGSTGDLPGDEGFQPWGWDASKLVPLLIREIQALRARVATLENLT